MMLCCAPVHNTTTVRTICPESHCTYTSQHSTRVRVLTFTFHFLKIIFSENEKMKISMKIEYCMWPVIGSIGTSVALMEA